MLTLLSTVKTRLGLAEIDPTFDSQLTQAIKAVSARFDAECNRRLARTVGFEQEFAAPQICILARCYPIEEVILFETKRSEAEGWVAEDAPYTLVSRRIIELAQPLHRSSRLARVTYTGGFVLPGGSPEPGQALLPDELEFAATEQVVFWFQNRERLGLGRIWEYHGTFRHFSSLDLLESVQAVLQRHRRYVL